MDRTVVAVCSDNAFALPGVRCLADADSRFEFVPESGIGAARVALVVDAEFDAGAARHPLARIGSTSTARVVLVVDRLHVADLGELASHRVVSIVHRPSAVASRLVAAIEVGLHSSIQPDALVAQLRAALEPAGGNIWHPADGPASQFTAVERELLRLLADGHDTVNVATRLGFSERTIKHMVQRLLGRAKLRNRAHAVAFAIREGVL